eukprot:6412692-Alexandrium_andersonii.AAC.1
MDAFDFHARAIWPLRASALQMLAQTLAQTSLLQILLGGMVLIPVILSFAFQTFSLVVVFVRTRPASVRG